MPPAQLRRTLTRAYGPGWAARLRARVDVRALLLGHDRRRR